MRSVLRPAAPFAIAAILLAGLTACAGDGGGTESTADCTAAPSGAASDAVEVADGAEGEAPEVTFDSPLEAESTQRTVVTAGEGDVLTDADTATIAYVILNGADGEVIEEAGYGGSQAVAIKLDGSVIAGLTDTLLCSSVGTRVVGVIPPAEAFGEQGSQLGLGADDNIVVVADVLEPVEPEFPEPKAWTDGVPTVDLEADPPVVTLPDTAPPTDLLLTVLEEGDGEVVAGSDSVTVDYQGTSWDTGEIFDQSYGGDPATFALSGVVQGFAAAIAGQKVGSTVLVSIPPALAYGEDPEGAQLGGQTLVFLIHIEAIAD